MLHHRPGAARVVTLLAINVHGLRITYSESETKVLVAYELERVTSLPSPMYLLDLGHFAGVEQASYLACSD